MKNRDSAHPGRIKLTPVDEANGIYDLTRADEPQDPGTPLNKKLLDFAVAACGVTAGTATALTLDDEFGGFELVDGAKVNFRLHVASGLNPTLNVNGTGAKRIVDYSGMAIMSSVPAGVWLTAKYSAILDAYVLAEGAGMRWITQLTSTSSAIDISIPDGYTAYRLLAALRSNSSYTVGLTIKTNAGISIASHGVNLNDASNPVFTRNNLTYALFNINGGDYMNLVDMLIVRGTYNGITGMVNSVSGLGSFASVPTTTPIHTITLNGFSMKAGSTVVLEGIA